MKSLILISFKLISSATFILVIGLTFLTINPQKEQIVKSAKADIFSFSGVNDKNDFKRAMESIGIQARPYDFNGNIMYFGTSMIQSDSAESTAEIVQDALVNAGVNKENYLHFRDFSATYAPSKSHSKQRLLKALNFRKAMLSGEVVPIKKTKTRIEMSGITTPEGDILNVTNNSKVASLSERLNGYRFVEITQGENAQYAEILAVWTDDKFDVRRMANQEGVDQSPPDPDLPACIGCKRVRRVQALSESEPFNLNKWQANSNVDEIYSFYQRAMGNRGWKESGRQQKFDLLAKHIPSLRNIQGRALSMEKDGRVVKITILPKSNGGAEIFSLEQYDGAQTILSPPKKHDAKSIGILNLFD